MIILRYTIMSLFSFIILACGKMEEHVETVSGSFVVEEVEPPPPNYKGGNFRSIKDWLTEIGKQAKPVEKVDEFSVGLFEGEDYYLALSGSQDSVVGNDQYSKIVFQPEFMYYKLNMAEYIGLTKEEMRVKIAEQLKEFTLSKMFKSCFLSEAKSFTIQYTGENLLHR